MERCCIIVAGGSGLRMGSELPKQFLPVMGIPVLIHTIRNFYNFDPALQLIVVLPAAEIESWKRLCNDFQFSIPHQITAGGNTRYESVKNGLSLVRACKLVAVHDGVRPLVSHDTLSRCFDCAAKNGSAIPVLPANESVRMGSMDDSVPVDRSQYFLVQTPQVFKTEIIKHGYQHPYIPQFTDDASVVEHSGTIVKMVMGNRENIKITFPEDLQIAALFLRSGS
jgi:2-C-methyl-D-erythritol 4-phosphate cytidylyltransferase